MCDCMPALGPFAANVRAMSGRWQPPPPKNTETHNGEPWVVRVLPKRFIDGVEEDVEPPQEGGGGSHHLHNEDQHTIPADGQGLVRRRRTP